MNIQLGILYGLVAMIGFGLASGISRNVSRSVGGPKSVFLKTLFGIPIIMVFLFLIPGEQYTLIQCLKIFGLGLVGYIPLLCFYKSLQYGDIGVLGPIANSSTVVTILLSVIFLGETVTLIQGLSIVLIIVGVIVLGLNVKSLQSGVSTTGLFFALIAAVGRGFMYFMFKIFTDSTGPIITALFIEVGVFVGSIIHCLIKKQSLETGAIGKDVLVAAITMGVLANIGGVGLNYGFSVASVPVVAAIFACSPLVSSLYGVIVYKEKLGIKERISIFAIIIGLVLLSGIFL